MIKSDIRNRIIAARNALPGKINPRQFALKAPNVDVSQYTKYEKGGPLGADKIMELCSKWGINLDWVQTGKGKMFLNGDIPPNPDPDEQKPQYFTADQLFHMYMKAMERQDNIMKDQTAILRNIESNMAREKTLAEAEVNLNFVVASVKKISKIQDSGLKDLQGRLSTVQKSQSDLSRDVHSKLDQSDEDGKKQGNHP